MSINRYVERVSATAKESTRLSTDTPSFTELLGWWYAIRRESLESHREANKRDLTFYLSLSSLSLSNTLRREIVSPEKLQGGVDNFVHRY
jgi:hypothetical protein